MASAAVNKGGRPSKFTQALLDEICERLSEGEPLAVICRDAHMPSVVTVRNWGLENEEVSYSLAGARELGMDSIAYRTRAVARGEGDSTGDVQRDKLIIETDLKLLKVWDPKRYGEKLDVTSDGKQLNAQPTDEQLALDIFKLIGSLNPPVEGEFKVLEDHSGGASVGTDEEDSSNV